MRATAKPLILSLETATRSGGVCLSHGHKIIAVRQAEAQTTTSTHLLPHIEALLKQCGRALTDVDLFAAAVGPGSFTGLRYGLATVKAFAATLKRPCIGAQTLAAVAHAAGAARRTMALLPAGRGEVYAQLFEVGESGVRSFSAPCHRAPQQVIDDAATLGALKWAGEGAQLHANLIEAKAHSLDRAFIVEETVDGTESDATRSLAEEVGAKAFDDGEAMIEEWVIAAPKRWVVESVAWLAAAQYAVGEVYRAEDLQAVYVRLSDAEMKEQWSESHKPHAPET